MCHLPYHHTTLGASALSFSKGRRVDATYSTIAQASDDIAKCEQALVDGAALRLPQLVVPIILGGQSAALTASQIHKV